MKKFVLSFLFCTVISCFSSAENFKPTLKKVVFYKNGLGYFQIHGQVTGNETFTIQTKDSQIDDILSSLYVLDLSGGKITSVSYSLNKNRAEDILIKLPVNGGLRELLKELKGVEISIVSTINGNIKGKIVGIEPINEIVDNRTISKDYTLSLFEDNGSLTTVPLSTISKYEILNKTLKKDLSKLLDLSLEAKYRHRKSIAIATAGDGTRNIILGYLLKVPVWKTTYRMIFDKNDDKAPLLLGYAIVENTTESDWSNVQVDLVSGAPLSFIMNLSQPTYVERPTVPVPGLKFLNVNWNKLTGASIASNALKPARSFKRKEAFAAAPGQLAMESCSDSVFPKNTLIEEHNYAQIAAQTSRVNSKGQKIGEMFVYKTDIPVSISSGQAAMVPIISEKLTGEKIFYFNNRFSDNISKAFALKNNSKITLDAGPVTFFQQDASLGEGIIKEPLLPDTEIVIPYTIANSLVLKSEINNKKSDYIKGSIVNGLLKLTYTKQKTTVWNIENRTSKNEVVWIDQPVTSGYKLQEPAKANDIVSNSYRFKLKVKPKQSFPFTVKESSPGYQIVSLANASEDTLLLYYGKGYISDADKKVLNKLKTLAAQRTELTNSIAELNRQIQTVTADQKRLRQNISMLYNSRNTKEQKLKAKWIDKVAKNEEAIDKAYKKIQAQQAQLHKVKKEIAKICSA